MEAAKEQHKLQDPISNVECYKEDDDQHVLTEADGPSKET